MLDVVTIRVGSGITVLVLGNADTPFEDEVRNSALSAVATRLEDGFADY